MNLIVESLHYTATYIGEVECFFTLFFLKRVSLLGLAMGGQMSVVRIVTESELQFFFVILKIL